MLCRATRDRRVMVESSDKTWSTGERHGKPLQYSCLENPMNRMTRQKDIATNKQLHMKFLIKRNWTRDVSDWSDLVALAEQPCRTALQDSLLWGNWYCYLSPSIKSGIWILHIFTSRSPIFNNSLIILFVRWTIDRSIDISNNCSEIVSLKLERKKKKNTQH